MKVIATVAFAFAFLHMLCHATHRQEVDITDDMQEETIVDTKDIGKLLTMAATVILGGQGIWLKQLKVLGITIEGLECIQQKAVESGVYAGRVLKLNKEIIDIECATGQITVANPEHFHTDTGFRDPNLFTVDNVALHLECNMPEVSAFAKLMGKNWFGSKFGKEEGVWEGQPLCDIRKVEIQNPIVSVETLNIGFDKPDGADYESLKRTFSNVERFVAKALHTFQNKGKEEAVVNKKLDVAELEAIEEQAEAAEASNQLITWNSIQRTTCLDHPYSKTSEFSTYEGLCGFVLPHLTLTIDGIEVRWTQDHTKAVAKLMARSKQFTLIRVLFNIMKYVHFLAGPLGGIINGGVMLGNKVGKALDHFNPFSKNFFGKK